MNAAQPSANQKRMNSLRRLLGGAMPDWTIEVDHTGTYVVASDGPNVERVFRIQDGASFENRELALAAVSYLFFIVKMYDAVVQRFLPERKVPATPDKSANYAAECAMKCDDRKFRQFLSVCHGVDISDAERIATRIRSMLRIASRADLNTDSQAANRWRDLVRDYESWERSQ